MTEPELPRSAADEQMLQLAVAQVHDSGVPTIVEGDDGSDVAVIVSLADWQELGQARIVAAAMAAEARGAAQGETIPHVEAMRLLGRDRLGARVQAA